MFVRLLSDRADKIGEKYTHHKMTYQYATTTPFEAAKHHFQSGRLEDGVSTLIAANPGASDGSIAELARAMGQAIALERIRQLRSR